MVPGSRWCLPARLRAAARASRLRPPPHMLWSRLPGPGFAQTLLLLEPVVSRRGCTSNRRCSRPSPPAAAAAVAADSASPPPKTPKTPKMAVEVDAASTTAAGAGVAPPQPPHEIVVVGGSYGGISAILNLLHLIDGTHHLPDLFPEPLLTSKSTRGVHITLVDERDGFFHTVGTPLAHTSKKYTESFWKRYASLQQLQRKEVSVFRGSVKRIDCDAHTATFSDLDHDGKEFQQRYDYLILATGLRRKFPAVPRELLKADYVREGIKHVNGIENASGDGVVVIGGGAVGIEMAAEIKLNHPTQKVTLVHSRAELLSNEPLPVEVKERAHEILKEEGVRVILGQRATVTPNDDATSSVALTNGEVLKAGHVIPTVSGWTPVSDALPSEAVDEHGYVKINGKMNFSSFVPNAARHFAIGDVAAWSGIRRAGAAMAMGRIAAHNILSDLLLNEGVTNEPHTTEFPEVPPMIALAVGSQAITYGPKQGVKSGKELMEQTFGSDLGWANTLKHFRLTEVEEKMIDGAELEKLEKLSLDKEVDKPQPST